MKSYLFIVSVQLWLIFGILLLNVTAATTITTATTEDYNCADDQDFQQNFRPQIESKQADVRRIFDYVLHGADRGRTYAETADFVDRFGSRLSGTQNLENAIDYMIEKLRHKERHDNVHGEPVSIPPWTRGNEWATIVKPLTKKMNILGLGSSVGTNNQTVEATAIVVRDFDELERRSSEVAGKIVVYNFRFHSYGREVKYRTSGASRAAKHGAIAAMIRSVTPFSIDSPHTGHQVYGANVTKIPAISITVEDAELLQRIADRKEQILIRFYSENRPGPQPVISRNTISEILGDAEHKQEIVLISGHLDSWDVGQGAMDDGAGAFIAWRALSVIRQLNLRPRRTIRSVLWTGEEFGLLGAEAYVQQHKSEMANHVLAMESDIGTFTPIGFTFSGANRTARCAVNAIAQMMAPINATGLRFVTDGSDTMMLQEKGVPITSLDTEDERYFYYHHSNGDMMTVENSEDLDKCLALWTSLAYVLAAIEYPLPR